MSSLRAIGLSQDGELKRFRAGTDESSLLAELVETHCLLELAKVAGGCADIAAYAEHVVAILTQFVGLAGCAVRIEADGLPPVKATFGRLGDTPSPGSVPLCVADRNVGELMVACPSGRAEFFATVAELVSSSVEAIIDNDRLRRRAAAAAALQLASTLGDEATDEALAGLVAALAALPTATGAKLVADHGAFGRPVERESGQPTVLSDAHLVETAGGSFGIEVFWAGEPSASERQTLDAVLVALSGSLSRADDRRHLEAELDTDVLTGVGNRRRGTRDLAQAISRAERSREPVALLYLDLDHFKQVNDTLGHDAGDAVLHSFAQGVADDLRGYDSVARIGGEEFVVICPGLDTPGAASLANRLRARTPDWTASVLPEGWTQTVSIGVAVYPTAADNGPGLISAADAAMYRAKQAGRDQVQLAAPAP